VALGAGVVVSAFTPRPWRINGGGTNGVSEWDSIYGSDHTHGTFTTDASGKPVLRPREVFVASVYRANGDNASLIVKAPDMLHCLKVICCHAEGREDLDVALHLDVARALIAEVEAA
jgi:hypothetical protein